MNTMKALAAALALLALPALVTPARAAERVKYKPGKTWTLSFEADTLGRPPVHSLVRGGAWSVEADSTAPGGRVLRQSEDDDGVAFHWIQFERPFLEDVRVSVQFRIKSGEIDPTAGLVFQSDAKGRNGYLVRLTGKSDEVAFHYLLSGRRRDIQFAKIPALAPGGWHTLALEHIGARLRVTYDGAEVLQAREERYARGIVGLWTEDDTVVDFANLQVGVP